MPTQDKEYSALVMYHLPDANEAWLLRQSNGEPRRLKGIADMQGRSGYVLAPFEHTNDSPLLLIEPDSVEQLSLASESLYPSAGNSNFLDFRQFYARDFEVFHDALLRGQFKKIVLARSSRCFLQPIGKPGARYRRLFSLPEDYFRSLFLRACQLYPHQYVTLVSTASSGTWLMATPELLLSHEGDSWRTMSLAGTMPLEQRDEPWSQKNLTEQDCVTQYIREIVEPMSEDLRLDGPRTAQAGNVVHLRTDFAFRLRHGASASDLLSRLFPTPAVCGVPKDAAKVFILQNEHIRRAYYSGFSGPLMINGSTHLFVTLRCVEFLRDTCIVYAGSGLLPESTLGDEYQETEAKMQTMKILL